MGDILAVLLAAGAGVLVGILRGGSVANLRAEPVRLLPAAAAGLVVLVLLPTPLLAGSRFLRVLGPILAVLAILALLVAARANMRLPGVPLLALGLLVNLVVIVANAGMPAPRAALERAHLSAPVARGERPDAYHILENKATLLWLLDDRFALPQTVASVGDAAVYAGLFLLLQGLVLAGAGRPEDAGDDEPPAEDDEPPTGDEPPTVRVIRRLL